MAPSAESTGVHDTTPLMPQTKPEKAIPIAICGMSLRLPGGTSSPQEFWDFLLNKGDGRAKVPESRYDVSAYHEKEKKAGSIASEYGYFLDENVPLGALDTSRFTLSKAELEFADPQQRRLLEVVGEALDESGDVNYRGSPIGCYVGNMGEDWGELMNRDPLSHGQNRIDGYNDWMLGNRISYEFGLKGPSMTIRTACSSALTCLNEACTAIQRGVCQGAVVCGVTIIMAPGTTQSMTEKGILSPNGSCKTFDADADGYARGEAVTAIYVKPLVDAIRDGNPIRGVIRATMASSDGKTQGITNPSGEAHEAMIRATYEKAGLNDFNQTAFFECHGTGTAVGDPIETDAVANVFSDNGNKGIHITSVKPNVGHTEGASGLVSLIKAAMAIENRTIPPNIKFNKPNPRIPFTERKLTVPTEPTPFPEDRKARVSVNSFGLGGSNAHVIIDSVKEFEHLIPKKEKDVDSEGHPQLLLYSAASAPSLKAMAANYDDFLNKRPDMQDQLEDLAYTLANRRVHYNHRSFRVVGGNSETPASAGRRMPTQPMNLVMVFTGQGAQWPRMGRELLLRDDLPFQKTIRELDEYLQNSSSPPEWTIEKELNKSAKTSQVAKAELSQPLCTAVQIGLVDMFKAIGVEPAAVVGHSSGELGAAYAAGALTAKEAIIGAHQRGQAAKLQNRKGAMAAVGLGWADVERFLKPPHVVVACENSPKSVTLSGDAEEVKAVVAAIKEEFPDITARLLKVEKAYHSYHMAEIGDDYCRSIEKDLEGKVPTKPFFSSVYGDGKPTDKPLGAKYWQQNLESPVRFNPAVAGIIEHIKNPAFLEVGPHGALAGPARQIFAESGASPPYVSAMARNEDCVETYLSAVGKLFELNIPIDLPKLTPNGGTCLYDLPRYPWNHAEDPEEYWYESRMSKEWRFPQFPKHPLLGRRQLECTALEPSFRNLINIADAPWISDHMIEGTVIFPAAGYLAMVGEAVRQISGGGKPEDGGYKLRNVVLSQALVLTDGVDTEVVTNLHPVRLTENTDSIWWEFSVASYNGQSWMKHCTGQTRPLTEDEKAPQAPADAAEPLPRKLETKKTYDTLTKAGMEYGPRFQRLSDITAGTTEPKASGNVTTELNGDEGQFHLHPAVIDAALQSGLIASNYGKIDAYNSRAMPTQLGNVTVFGCPQDAKMTVTADTQLFGTTEIGGKFQCIADGKVVMSMDETRFTRLDDGGIQNPHHLPITARVSWLPHVDFSKVDQLIKPAVPREQWTPILDEMAKLALAYTGRRTDQAGPKTQKYASWVNKQVDAFDQSSGLTSMDDATIIQKIKALQQKTAGSPVAPSADALVLVVENIENLLNGEKEIIHLLQNDNVDVLSDLFKNGNNVDRSELIRSVAHLKPNLRVLEICSGPSAGLTTPQILADLVVPTIKKPLYSKYTLTDTSSASFGELKKKFEKNDNMEFKALDISKDPLEQGFAKEDEEKYDLVIATNVIHGTTNVKESLSNVAKLMHPNGRFLLQELNPSSKWINFVLGHLEDWWCGADDGRVDEPYIAPSRWASELQAAGFAAPEAAVLDAQEPHQLNAVISAKLAPTVARETSKKITLLVDGEYGNATALEKQLSARGYSVERHGLGDKLPEGQDIISLLDESAPFLENPTEERFEAFKKLIAELGDAGLFWVTRPSQMYCTDPRYAQIIGASRSIRNEELVAFATCEVDDLQASASTVVDVFSQFQKRADDGLMRPDYEYAITKDTIYIPRVYPFALEKEPLPEHARGESQMALVAEKAGRLSSLQWKPREAKKQLGDDEIEIQVFASGVSSKDVSDFQGTGRRDQDKEGLGLDASGIVSRVGSNVKHVQAGDRVMALTAEGSLASHVVTQSGFVAKIPDALTFAEAATIPAAFCTAIVAFFAGDLKAGQSVLIHSAASSVGLAAIQVASLIQGVDIYATAGTEEKMDYLANTVGIPRNRIFSSRDTGFLEGIRRETDGKGVDLVLNSLSGDLLHASWDSVAEFGRMVELGEKDLAGAGKLDLSAFLGGRSYTGVHLDTLMKRKDSCVKTLMSTTAKYLKDGKITPINPRTVFEADAVQDAFKQIQEGEKIGKTVEAIRDPADGSLTVEAAPVKPSDVIKLDPAASYLLAGGLGGIASVMARHMVENGARRLVCLSRNPGAKAEDKDRIQEFESMGCEVRLVKGDLSSKEDVERAVKECPNLKGVIHAPMLLQDEAFKNMSVNQWMTASNPKVRGAWNLHEATLAAGADLDFFVFLSSMSGLNGQPGQANYAGANTFLDAFAQFRNSQGLAASSVDIGAVSDMGYAARDDALLQRLIKNGYSGVTEGEMIEATSALVAVPPAKMDKDSTEFVHHNTFATGFGSTMSLSNPDSRSWWKQDIRMAVWHNINEGGGDDAGGDSLKSFLAGAKADPDVLRKPETSNYFAMEIGKHMMKLLLKSEDDLDVTLPVAQLGLDSLVGIEVRNWWRQVFGLDISVLQILGLGTLEGLGKHAAEGLLTAMGQGKE